MARNSARSNSAPVVTVTVADTDKFPALDALMAAGKAAAAKEAWKAQAATFCKHYSRVTGADIGIDDVKLTGAYHYAFKAWQALQ